MALLKLYLAQCTDVLAIRLTCAECQSSVSLSLTDPRHVPNECPSCGTSWFMGDDADRNAAIALIRTLAQLGKRSGPCQILLELDQPQ